MLIKNISLYGLVYLLGFLLLFYSLKIKNNKTTIDALFISVYCALFTIISGRLGYVIFYELSYYLNNPFEIIQFHKGGMSFHGASLGLFIFLLLFLKNKALYLLDKCTLVALITLPLGRICNFLNGELYGRVTDFKYAVIFEGIDDLPRFPSQIFEAIYEGPVIALFLYLIYKFKGFKKVGELSCFFIIFYSLGRFFIEFTREPDLSVGYLAFNLSLGQYLCIAQLGLGLFMLKLLRA